MRILGVIHPYRALDERSDSRRPIDLNASLRRAGGTGNGCLILDISAAGFRARVREPLAPSSEIWLRIPGFDALAARIVWAERDEIGCAFEQPLDATLVDSIVADAPQLQ